MEKILLIDDEESIVNVLSISLKSDNYDVVSAYSGKEGLDVFKRESPDIVITDIKMPGMDGIEVLKRMKEMNPETEVIIITGHGDMDSAIEALQLGASDFINKPIRDEALSIALSRAREKIDIRRKLKEYTEDLENMVKIATEEVRRKSEFQAKLIYSSLDGIVATNEHGKVVIYNPSAERIFGYPRPEVIRGMHIDELYTPEIKSTIENDEREDGFFWKEVTIVSKDKERIPARFSGSTLYGEGMPIGNVAFFQDLREIKNLERELIRSERLAAIGQTIAGLAHYIKNILTGLKGGSYIANIGYERNDMKKLGRGWQMIQKNIGRISDLVLSLLTYSKERKPEYEKLHPNEIVKEIFELTETKAGENDVDMEMELDESIPEVMMDMRVIHDSLLNLVSNAIDACIFDEDQVKKHTVRVKTTLEPDNYIRFDVEDNGIGMTDDVKEKIFTGFYSTKLGKGTGLGLLVTKKLVEDSGGSIIFDSQPGSGTTFFMRLAFKDINNGKEQQ